MKTRLLAGAVAAILAITAGGLYWATHHHTAVNQSETTGGGNQTPALPRVAHIFVIVEENETAQSVINNPQMPYFNSLVNKYSLATNYSAVTHPSLPNYIALTSASTRGIDTDCNPPAGCVVGANNLADEIANTNRSWKEYAENMPSSCYAQNSGEYATKHVPFLYYDDILNDRARCQQHIVPFSQLSQDLKSASTTPNFAFISPNLCNDMHDCPPATGDAWLKQEVPMILDSPAFTSSPSLLVITWDEGTSSDNRVATVFAGSAAKTGYKSPASYDHYSLVKTIEQAWGLPAMTDYDARAEAMADMLK